MKFMYFLFWTFISKSCRTLLSNKFRWNRSTIKECRFFLEINSLILQIELIVLHLIFKRVPNIFLIEALYWLLDQNWVLIQLNFPIVFLIFGFTYCWVNTLLKLLSNQGHYWLNLKMQSFNLLFEHFVILPIRSFIYCQLKFLLSDKVI